LAMPSIPSWQKLNFTMCEMNPSSLEIDVSAVHRQKDIYKLFGSELDEDEGSPSTIENIFCARQLVTNRLNDIYIIKYQVVK
jgi:hypothetical protein